MIRLVFVLRRKPGMTLAEFQQYWRGVHGPLVAKQATTLDIHRYVQVHTLDDAVNDQLAGARGKMERPYDGVAELWWKSREALTASFGSAAGKAESCLKMKRDLSICRTLPYGSPMNTRK